MPRVLRRVWILSTFPKRVRRASFSFSIVSAATSVRAAVRRTASGWEEMSWEDAIAYAADGLRRTARRHGRHAQRRRQAAQ